MSYKVQTKTSAPHYKQREFEVIRRYRDFAWLHARLQEQFRGACRPGLLRVRALAHVCAGAFTGFREQRAPACRAEYA